MSALVRPASVTPEFLNRLVSRVPGSTGQTWKLFDLAQESVARYGYPYLMFHRADLHAVLAGAIRARRPDAIRTGHKAVGCEQDAGGVTLRIEARRPENR